MSICGTTNALVSQVIVTYNNGEITVQTTTQNLPPEIPVTLEKEKKNRPFI